MHSEFPPIEPLVQEFEQVGRNVGELLHAVQQGAMAYFIESAFYVQINDDLVQTTRSAFVCIMHEILYKGFSASTSPVCVLDVRDFLFENGLQSFREHQLE